MSPVKPCVCCGTLTRSQMLILDHSLGVSAPLCCECQDLSAAEKAVTAILDRQGINIFAVQMESGSQS